MTNDSQSFNLIGVMIASFAVALIPFVIVTMTGFLKISVVMMIVRNALGIQQTPPNVILYAIALVLTVYVSMPVITQVYNNLTERPINMYSLDELTAAADKVKAPIQERLMRFTKPDERRFFQSATAQVWGKDASADLKETDLRVLVPAFVASELTRAFEIGFLLYLPFLIIDLIVANILMSMGMMMVSPTLISTPFKLLLFVSVSGWSKLLHGLILSYA